MFIACSTSNRISAEACSEVGQGTSGETYLVGADRTMRNEPRFLIEDKDAYLVVITESSADYGSTVTLSAEGPVFALSAGYTASSIDADVVDNRWEGTSVEPVTVPEPSASASTAAVLLALAGARRLIDGSRRR